MGTRRLLLGLTLLLMVPAIAGAGGFGDLFNAIKTVQKAVKPADSQQEQQIGRAAAATLLGAAKPLDDRAVQRYVNEVGMWVASHSDRPDLPWRFAVVDSDDIDAFAAPGGYVFITRGLLLHLRSEAELAGVLGHEITHVVMKHHLKALQRAARIDLLGRAAQYELKQHGKDSEVFDRIAGATRNLYAKGLDKDDEFEADRMGVVLAARAGYDPYGLVAVLQTLQSIDPKNDSVQLLLATHPSPAARIAALFTAMDGRMARYGKLAEGRTRFLKAVASLK